MKKAIQNLAVFLFMILTMIMMLLSFILIIPAVAWQMALEHYNNASGWVYKIMAKSENDKLLKNRKV